MFKKALISTVALGLASAFVTSAHAEGQFYAGGGVAVLESSADGGQDDLTFKEVYGRLGMMFGDYFSGEARVGFGFSGDSVGGNVDVDIDNFYGAYVRAGAPVAESFYPYVVLGYTRLETSISGYGVDVSDSDSDISYGLGFDLSSSDSLTFNVEYMKFYDEDGVEVDGLSFGLATSF